MFAGQSDVIIRSDVTSGVHPPIGTVVACHYHNFFNVRRRALLLPGIYHRCESAHF